VSVVVREDEINLGRGSWTAGATIQCGVNTPLASGSIQSKLIRNSTEHLPSSDFATATSLSYLNCIYANLVGHLEECLGVVMFHSLSEDRLCTATVAIHLCAYSRFCSSFRDGIQFQDRRNAFETSANSFVETDTRSSFADCSSFLTCSYHPIKDDIRFSDVL